MCDFLGGGLRQKEAGGAGFVVQRESARLKDSRGGPGEGVGR